jgi:hypothetical protein
VKTRSPKTQKQVLYFIDFLQVKNDRKPETSAPEHKFKSPDGTLISVYETAQQWAICVDGLWQNRQKFNRLSSLLKR